MKKKIMVLGSRGMLGHQVVLFLKTQQEKYFLLDVARSPFTENTILVDASDMQELELVLRSHQPDIVINCIGVLVKQSKNNPAMAIQLNAYLPCRVASIINDWSGKLIQISTDCVFSGNSGGYYEEDIPDGRDVYALTKILGEQIGDENLVIRTSIIGPELKADGTGLFHWFMMQKGEVDGYSKVFWNGLTTPHLAKIIFQAIEEKWSGIHHIGHELPISKYHLLGSIKLIMNKKDVEINEENTYTSDKSLRTMWSSRAVSIPDYFQMLQEMRESMVSNMELYPHYSI